MFERIRGLRPSYAGVTATVALVFALGMGGAYAAEKIGSNDVAKSAVKSKHIKDGQVRTADVATNAVTNAAIADGAVNATKIADGAVSGAKIADAAVGSADLADDSVTAAKIGNGAVSRAELADNVVNCAKIADETVGTADIGIGAEDLRGVTTAVSAGETVTAGTVRTTAVNCPAGRLLIAGGFAWRFGTDSSIVTSAPSETDPDGRWVVSGRSRREAAATRYSPGRPAWTSRSRRERRGGASGAAPHAFVDSSRRSSSPGPCRG